ncbi:MAG: hypothetical protein ACRC62_34670 [Microcoleus sp.]
MAEYDRCLVGGDRNCLLMTWQLKSLTLNDRLSIDRERERSHYNSQRSTINYQNNPFFFKVEAL